MPSVRPSSDPTSGPTGGPSGGPTSGPTGEDTNPPDYYWTPLVTPTSGQTSGPTSGPTSMPSNGPSLMPSAMPMAPSSAPTSGPSYGPTFGPTSGPTAGPTTSGPRSDPTVSPTASLRGGPTKTQTSSPTSGTTSRPTSGYTSDPTSGTLSGPTSVSEDKKKRRLPEKKDFTHDTPTVDNVVAVHGVLGLALGLGMALGLLGTYMKHTKAKRKRNRRPLPDRPQYIAGKPTKDDVVAGRGGGSNNHPGNDDYWKIILANRESYKTSKTNGDKTRLAEEILDFIKSKNGRFLQKEKGEMERWFLLTDKVAISKVKQTLRDTYIPTWARNGLRVSVKGLVDKDGCDKTGIIIAVADDRWKIRLDIDKALVYICNDCQKHCIPTNSQSKDPVTQEVIRTMKEFDNAHACELCDNEWVCIGHDSDEDAQHENERPNDCFTSNLVGPSNSLPLGSYGAIENVLTGIHSLSDPEDDVSSKPALNLNLDGIHPSYTTFASIPLNNTNDSELCDLDDSQPSDLDLGNDFVRWMESWFRDAS